MVSVSQPFVKRRSDLNSIEMIDAHDLGSRLDGKIIWTEMLLQLVDH